MSLEEKAHDLAILYIQGQIKQDLVTVNTGHDAELFVEIYDFVYRKILDELTRMR